MLNHVYTDEDVAPEYLKSEANCTSPAVYYKNCATCDAKGTATFTYGTSSDHNFSKEVISSTYKKSNATCTSKAIYYYCCTGCTAKGGEEYTFEYGNTLAHSFTKQEPTDDYLVTAAGCTTKAVYYYCCATCDQAGTRTYQYGNDLGGHIGGTATCSAKAVCERCDQEYGSVLNHVYTDEDVAPEYLKSEANCTSPAVYYKNCATCDAKGTATFTDGDALPHDYINKVANKYIKTPETCTTKAVYYESCSYCGIKGTETFEFGDEPGHNYKATWSSNSESHWHQCSRCGDKKDVENHISSGPATTTDAEKCTVCDYVITPASGHTHTYTYAWATNENEHWFSCTTCGNRKNYREHVYDNNCDSDCNICGYNRVVIHTYDSEWVKVENMHCKECTVCGYQDEVYIHIPGPAATETSPQVCTICSYVIQDVVEHTHDYDWANDASKHWKECSCGSKIETAAHKWNSGVVTKEATESAEGVKTYTCTVCSATKTESIPKLPVTPDEPSTDNPSTDKPSTDKPSTDKPSAGQPATDKSEEDNTATVVVVVVASVAVVGGGGAAAVVVLIKTGKIPMPVQKSAPVQAEQPKKGSKEANKEAGENKPTDSKETPKE